MKEKLQLQFAHMPVEAAEPGVVLEQTLVQMFAGIDEMLDEQEDIDVRVAWCGMAWRGMAWRGVAWRGVAWHGASLSYSASEWVCSRACVREGACGRWACAVVVVVVSFYVMKWHLILHIIHD